jgi:hypothetical protein
MREKEEKENSAQQVKLDHSFCVKFRKEIEGSRLKAVIDSLIDSKSETLPKKKAFLARACQRQKSFMKKVEEYISALCKERPNKAVALLALRDELRAKN